MDPASLGGVPLETTLVRGPTRQNAVTLMSWLVVAEILTSSRILTTESLEKTLQELGHQGRSMKWEARDFAVGDYDGAVDREIAIQETNVRNWFFHAAQEEHPNTVAPPIAGEPPQEDPHGPFYDRFGEGSPERPPPPPSPVGPIPRTILVNVVADPNLPNGIRSNVTVELLDEDKFYRGQGPAAALVVGCRRLPESTSTNLVITPVGMWYHLRIHRDLGASGGPIKMGDVTALLVRIYESATDFYDLEEAPEGWDDMACRVLRVGQSVAVKCQLLLGLVMRGDPKEDYVIPGRECFLYYSVLPDEDAEAEHRDAWPPAAKRRKSGDRDGNDKEEKDLPKEASEETLPKAGSTRAN